MNTKLIKCGFASNKSEMRWWTASKQYNWRKESSLELSLSETIKLQFCFLCVGGFCVKSFLSDWFWFFFSSHPCLKEKNVKIDWWCTAMSSKAHGRTALSFRRLSAIDETVGRLSAVCHVHELNFYEQRKMIARYSRVWTANDLVLTQPVRR